MPVQHGWLHKSASSAMGGDRGQAPKDGQLGIITPEPTPSVGYHPLPTQGWPIDQDTNMLRSKGLKVIISKNHKASMFEEVTHKLSGSAVFSKLDTHHGFLSVHIEHESSLITSSKSLIDVSRVIGKHDDIALYGKNLGMINTSCTGSESSKKMVLSSFQQL